MIFGNQTHGRDMEVGLKPSVLPWLCLMKGITVAIKKSKMAWKTLKGQKKMPEGSLIESLYLQHLKSAIFLHTMSYKWYEVLKFSTTIMYSCNPIPLSLKSNVPTHTPLIININYLLSCGVSLGCLYFLPPRKLALFLHFSIQSIYCRIKMDLEVDLLSRTHLF